MFDGKAFGVSVTECQDKGEVSVVVVVVDPPSEGQLTFDELVEGDLLVFGTSAVVSFDQPILG